MSGDESNDSYSKTGHQLDDSSTELHESMDIQDHCEVMEVQGSEIAVAQQQKVNMKSIFTLMQRNPY